jgi:hypothetical protein
MLGGLFFDPAQEIGEKTTGIWACFPILVGHAAQYSLFVFYGAASS